MFGYNLVNLKDRIIPIINTKRRRKQRYTLNA